MTTLNNNNNKFIVVVRKGTAGELHVYLKTQQQKEGEEKKKEEGRSVLEKLSQQSKSERARKEVRGV